MTDARKSIFITGAASGIGRASAQAFAAAGWRVGLSDLDAGALARLKAELGEQASIHPADVRDSAGLGAALAAFCADGGLSALFNCAGILEMRTFGESSIERLHDIVAVNVNGVINGIHAALPYLRRAGAAHVISMSSAAAIYGVPEEAVYSASKFAVRGLTEALNIELEAEGIWVCDVMVAYVATPMVLAAEAQAKSVGILGVNVQAKEVAQTVLAAATGRQVHWLVTDADRVMAMQVDATPWESRRDIMKAITGF